MISALTATGDPARNALPTDTRPANAVRPDGVTADGVPADGVPADEVTADGVPANKVQRNGVPGSLGPVSAGPVAARLGGEEGERAVQEALPLPSRLPASAASLLRAARRGLDEAGSERDPATRYVIAHLAALRAAAAILAARGEPGSGGRRRRPRSVWDLLPQVEPALAEWAAFFAASAAKRAAAEAGLPRAASAREADDLLRDAGTFLVVAERALGLADGLALPMSLRHAS